MTTAFSKVVAAVVAVLGSTPAVSSTIYRARPTDLPDQVESAVNVYFETALPQLGAIAGAPVDWISKINVECYARSLRDSGDIAVDPLFEAVYERLARNPTLGGVVDDLVISAIEAENTAEAKKTGWVRLTYMARHRTGNDSLD